MLISYEPRMCRGGLTKSGGSLQDPVTNGDRELSADKSQLRLYKTTSALNGGNRVPDQKPFFLELSLIESSGLWFKPGKPSMYCWLGATHTPRVEFGEARIQVLSADRTTTFWRELNRELNLEQASQVRAELERIGLPGTAPEVQGVIDTSDGWNRLLFSVRTESGACSITIDMQSSGFEGRDAPALRSLFRQLFSLAGFVNFSPTIYEE